MGQHSLTFYNACAPKIYLKQFINRQMLKTGDFMEIGTKPPQKHMHTEIGIKPPQKHMYTESELSTSYE